MVFMTTSGGDPHAAYRIARALQHQYDIKSERRGHGQEGNSERHFYLFVDSACMSAGTLVALGATHLVLSDYAQLGPLDVQIRRPDEPMQRDSGLTPAQALTSLERRSKSLFKAHFEQLRNDGTISLTTRTAVENASTLTSGLMRSIYGQIDPMRLGEVERLMEIAAQYGQRLGKFNPKANSISKLLTGYPSHNFVIDRQEAETLFKNVEPPKEILREFGEYLRRYAKGKMDAEMAAQIYWNEAPDVSFDEQKEQENGEQDSRNGGEDSVEQSEGNGEDGEDGTNEG